MKLGFAVQALQAQPGLWTTQKVSGAGSSCICPSFIFMFFVHCGFDLQPREWDLKGIPRAVPGEARNAGH